MRFPFWRTCGQAFDDCTDVAVGHVRFVFVAIRSFSPLIFLIPLPGFRLDRLAEIDDHWYDLIVSGEEHNIPWIAS